MPLKNPVRPLCDSSKNKTELSKLSQKEWEDLSDAKKLSRIALCEELKDFTLLNVKYDRDEIISRYNGRKNRKQNQIKKEYEETTVKHKETIVNHEEKICSLKENLKAKRNKIVELNTKISELETENEDLKKKLKSVNPNEFEMLKETIVSTEKSNYSLSLQLRTSQSINKDLEAKIEDIKSEYDEKISFLEVQLEKTKNEAKTSKNKCVDTKDNLKDNELVYPKPRSNNSKPQMSTGPSLQKQRLNIKTQNSQ